MKLPIKIAYVFIIFALLTSCEAETENKDMPIENEVTAFINNFEAPESGDFINSAYDAFIKAYPAGHCDVWSNGMISFYYYDPNSPKGYGAIYLDSNGEKAKPGGTGTTCIKKYKGEYASKENTPVDTTPVDTTPVDTTSGSTEGQSATDQEQSESIRDLTESIQKDSYVNQQQFDTNQQKDDTDQQQFDTDQQQDDTNQQQDDTDQKTTWGKTLVSFVKVALFVIMLTICIVSKDPIVISVFATVLGGFILYKFGWN